MDLFHSTIESAPERVDDGVLEFLIFAVLNQNHSCLELGIKELKTRKDDLSKARLQAEEEMIACGVQDVKLPTVQAYPSDLRNILEESDFTDRKAFLRSFIKKIVVDAERVVVIHKLPQSVAGVSNEIEEVLPIEHVGGAEGGRTPYLFNAIESLSQLSYSPNSQLYQNTP